MLHGLWVCSLTLMWNMKAETYRRSSFSHSLEFPATSCQLWGWGRGGWFLINLSTTASVEDEQCTTWDCKALFFTISPWHGWLDSVSQEHTKVVYCTYVLNASTKSMAKAYHDKCQSEKSKISQCLLRASKHHDWVYLLPPEIRQE